jgi:hypothetical protein
LEFLLLEFQCFYGEPFAPEKCNVHAKGNRLRRDRELARKSFIYKRLIRYAEGGFPGAGRLAFARVAQ